MFILSIVFKSEITLFTKKSFSFWAKLLQVKFSLPRWNKEIFKALRKKVPTWLTGHVHWWVCNRAQELLLQINR